MTTETRAVPTTWPNGSETLEALRYEWEDPVSNPDCAYCFKRAIDLTPGDSCCHPFTVALYLDDLAYGGPEEGGWFYRLSTPEGQVECENGLEVSLVLEAFERIAALRNVDRPSISSVASQGRYRVQLVQGEAMVDPPNRPRYE
jgi:hypothetical protein